MSDESETTWALKRAQELQSTAANARDVRTAARQQGERKLAQLQQRLEAIELQFGVRVDGENKPRATVVRDENGEVLVRWLRTDTILCGSFRDRPNEFQTDSVDEAFDVTYGFLMERSRTG
jgi:hypothetical protein